MVFNPIRAMAHRGLPLALYCLLAASLASAQTTSETGTATSAVVVVASEVTVAAASSSSEAASSKSSTTPITHTVDVAKGGFTFVPDVIQAVPGDTVRFSFYPTNHSVVRAEYKYPCIPYEMTGIDKVGFFSGFKPVDAILSEPPTFDLLINDSLPIFYYCSAPGSCINYAMVGVINPNSTVSLATQKQDAKSSKYMLQPGQNFPDEGDNPLASGYSSSESTSSPTSSSSSSTSSATATSSAAAASSSHSGGLSTGAIAGIAVGAAVVGLIVAALFFLWIRNKALNKKIKEAESARQLPPAGPEASERGSHFYGAPPSHVSGAYSMPDAHKSMQDRQSYVPSAYSPGLPQYAPPPHTMPSPHGVGVPHDQMSDGGMRSPGPTSPLVRPQDQDRTFSGFSTPPQEAVEKPASGPHELAASISRATKRLSGRNSRTST